MEAVGRVGVGGVGVGVGVGGRRSAPARTPPARVPGRGGRRRRRRRPAGLAGAQAEAGTVRALVFSATEIPRAQLEEQQQQHAKTTTKKGRGSKGAEAEEGGGAASAAGAAAASSSAAAASSSAAGPASSDDSAAGAPRMPAWEALQPAAWAALHASLGGGADRRRLDIAWDALRHRLQSRDPRKRLLAVLVTHELFMRSRVFREDVLLPDFGFFVRHSVGEDRVFPLPLKPEAAAARLRARALEVVAVWSRAHASSLRLLALGRDYVVQTLGVPLPAPPDPHAVSPREVAEAHRRERLRLDEYRRAACELAERLLPDAENTVREMCECFDILVPRIPDADEQEEEEEEEDEPDAGASPSSPPPPAPPPGARGVPETIRRFALGSGGYRLRVEIPAGPPSIETTDTKPVFEALRERYRELLRIAPCVARAQHALILATVPHAERAERDALLKRAIDTRNALDSARRRAELLHVDVDCAASAFEDDDGDWLEVAPPPPPSLLEEPEEEEEESDNDGGTGEAVAEPSDADSRDSAGGAGAVQEEEEKEEEEEKGKAMQQGEDEQQQQPEEEEVSKQPSPPAYVPFFQMDRGERERVLRERSEAPVVPESREALLAKAPVVPFFLGLNFWGNSKVQLSAVTGGKQREHRFLRGVRAVGSRRRAFRAAPRLHPSPRRAPRAAGAAAPRPR